MPVTLKEVAERAGVSRSAVSRTFTQGASVSAATRRKVETAARELGYSPNVLASSLTTRRTKLIGLVADNPHNPAFLPVFDLFTRGLQERGLRPLLVNLAHETDHAASVRMLRQYSVDGVVVASSTLPPAFARAFRDAEIPTVHSFGRPSRTPAAHVVTVDNRACGRLAAQTLIERGYRRIGFLGGPRRATSTQDRARGFVEAAAAAPDVIASRDYAAGYSYDAGHAAMAALIRGGALAEAYFCGDDVISIGALAALREADIRVPEAVGVLGMNDMEMARWSMIDLTTIHQPIREIITTSLERVVAMTTEPDLPPATTLFDCRLVERGTLKRLET